MSKLDFFFSPKSIAIIGASKDKNKGGYIILNNVKKGFKGKIYPVNPKYSEIDGIKCYKDVSSIPEEIDLAIVFIPSSKVLPIVEDLAKKQVKGIIIESGGFAESGEEGKSIQQRLLELKNKTGVRIWGPNCMGLVDMHKRHVFSFVSPKIWEHIYPGGISLIVQSGMLSAGFLIELCSSGRFGISKACSIGNKIDVDESDLLEFFMQDNDTKVIAMYLESIKDGQRFYNLCRRCKKPIVILKGGKSEEGAKAAITHTASAAGSYKVVSGMLQQAGVIEANDFNEMMDISLGLLALEDFSINGNRVAVITYSGGAGIVSADLLKENGLKLAILNENTINEIKSVAPKWHVISNPIDIWPAVEKSGLIAYEKTIYGACLDENVDIIFLHVFGASRIDTVDFSQLKEIVKKHGKIIFIWCIGDRESDLNMAKAARDANIPLFFDIKRAVEVLGSIVRCNLKRKNIEDIKIVEKVDKGPYRVVDEYLHSGILDEHKSKMLLSKIGIRCVDEFLVNTEEDLMTKANQLGYPVVLKGLLPDVVHKTEHGLVKTNIYTEDRLKYEYSNLFHLVKDNGKILLQKQVDIKLEFIAGITRDENFGPVVMFGLGGVLADIMEDKIFRLAPFSYDEALLFTYDLKNQKLLDGYRDYPKVDRNMVAHIIKTIGDIAFLYPKIRSIDINPLALTLDGLVALDATIVVD